MREHHRGSHDPAVAHYYLHPPKQPLLSDLSALSGKAPALVNRMFFDSRNVGLANVLLLVSSQFHPVMCM